MYGVTKVWEPVQPTLSVEAVLRLADYDDRADVYSKKYWLVD